MSAVDFKPRPSLPAPAPAPANLEAEQALLGAILINNDAWHRVADFLQPEHFSEDLHRRIYHVASELIRSGKVASPITLKTFLGDIVVVGGGDERTHMIPQYLARLAAEATTIINAPDYARMIADLAVRREIIEAAADLTENALHAAIAAAPAEIASSAISKLQDIGMTAAPANTRLDPATAATAVIERAKRIIAKEPVDTGISTGIADLDRDTGGFEPGTLWIMAGRPGMGKTVLATGFSLKVASRGLKDFDVGRPPAAAQLFSLEVPERQTIARLLSDLSYRPRHPISFGAIIRGALDDEDLWCLEDAQKRLAKMPLAVDVSSSLTVDEIRLRVRAESNRMRKRGFNLGVVFIDYLKFIRPTDRYRGSKVHEIGETTGALHQLAKDENLCVVLLHQLSRDVERREKGDRRPRLSDLRDSGEIEQDADVVAFIHREAYYIKESADFRNGDPLTMDEYFAKEHEAEIILGKTRTGPTGTVKIWCDLGASTFAAHAREPSQFTPAAMSSEEDEVEL